MIHDISFMKKITSKILACPTFARANYYRKSNSYINIGEVIVISDLFKRLC